MPRSTSVRFELFTRMKSLASAKLGRCVFCMRTSMIGTLASAALSALALSWPNRYALILTGLAAFLFGALAASHLVAYLYHTRARWVAFHQTRASVTGYVMPSRRELARTLVRAGAGVVLIGLTGPRSARGQAACAGFWGGIPLRVTGPSKAETLARYDLAALFGCDTECSGRSAACGAEPGPACVRTALPVGRSAPKCERIKKATDPLNQWECQGTITQCPCDCDICRPTRPNFGFNFAQGMGTTRAAAEAALGADAASKCNEFCSQRTRWCHPGRCEIVGDPTLQNVQVRQQGRLFTATAEIMECPCNCPPS